MKLRSKWLFISLFILMLGGIGMVILYQQRAKEEAELIRHEQERMVLYVASNYEGVMKVQFTKHFYNSSTGTYEFYATVNDKTKVNFTLWGLDGEIGMSQLLSQNSGAELIRLENRKEFNISDIEVIYLGD
ncbi:hypothetical protein [Streptococcus sp. DD13]|uniref:hypothetical protein n=1 Tax=Streptococcus sp. DD13 TaxID=1777881 RepID=UPI00079A739E|nr:hypothetical protein [Streptococcus sp. DD13]KXT78414.1 hypothetical protein STRDD13_00717 [Streptococcus sp. DD13]